MKRFRIFFLIIFLTSCGVVVRQDPKEFPTLSTPTSVVSAEIFAAQKAWENSPHAHTYGMEKGPNTYCARCHSPQNWDPTAFIDPPPKCVTCKFPSDPEIRMAKSNVFIPEAEWKSIGCNICHSSQSGTVSSMISWLDVSTGFYLTVSSVNELCEKCHLNSDTLKHKRELGSQVHHGFQCIDCHDPHTTTASCSTEQCHVKAELSSMLGLDLEHASISCPVCHDASGLTVDLKEGGWVLVRNTSFLGRETEEAYVSHNLQTAVNCHLCHFPENPWNLSGVDS